MKWIDWIGEHSAVILMVLGGAILMCVLVPLFGHYIRRWSRHQRSKRRPAWATGPKPPLQRADEPRASAPPSSPRVCIWDDEIVPYVDGLLAGYEREIFEGHLRDCDFCQSKVERIGALRNSYESTRECRWGIEVLRLYGPGEKGRWVLEVKRHLETCAVCRATQRVLCEQAMSNPEVQSLERAFRSPAKRGRTP